MTIQEHILSVLNQQPGNVCDDCLTTLAHLKRRQVAFSRCTALAEQGAIHRERGICGVCGKIKNVSRNFDAATPSLPATGKGEPPKPLEATGELSEYMDCWYWEGNIQSALITQLAASGYSIISVADTAARAPGKDIVAKAPNGKKLWISVKGYPAKGNASRNTQARHWFAMALFDLVLYREENSDVNLAVAFPDAIRTYQVLAKRTTWLRQAMPFRFFWVDSAGHVREDVG